MGHHFYDLGAPISVGYRVNSRKGTQSRICATERSRDCAIERSAGLGAMYHRKMEESCRPRKPWSTSGGADMTESSEQITRDPDVMGGKACVRGMRVTVGTIVGQIDACRSVEQTLDDYPYLEWADQIGFVRSPRRP